MELTYKQRTRTTYPKYIVVFLVKTLSLTSLVKSLYAECVASRWLTIHKCTSMRQVLLERSQNVRGDALYDYTNLRFHLTIENNTDPWKGCHLLAPSISHDASPPNIMCQSPLRGDVLSTHVAHASDIDTPVHPGIYRSTVVIKYIPSSKRPPSFRHCGFFPRLLLW